MSPCECISYPKDDRMSSQMHTQLAEIVLHLLHSCRKITHLRSLRTTVRMHMPDHSPESSCSGNGASKESVNAQSSRAW